ncbi:MAG: methyltransferase domain-containing protein [Thermodesulfobacteriota bacterium]|nr:methyltransferase domain-containing protein [Thermodesulfobacteriota bacterium]
MPEIDVDELMRRIRQEVQHRKNNFSSNSAGHGQLQNISSHAPFDQSQNTIFLNFELNMPKLEESVPEPEEKEQWPLNQFLQYHDHHFITLVYRFILHRTPDLEGFNHYLNALRQGIYTKEEIIGRLRYSPEGREKKFPVKGLLTPLAIRMLGKTPILGYGVRWLIAWLRLPVYVKNFQNFEAYQVLREHNLRQQIDQLTEKSASRMVEKLQGLTEHFASQLSEKSDRSQVSDLSSRLSAFIESLTQAVSEKAQQSDVEEKVNQLTEEFASHMAEKSQELTEQFSSRLSEKSDRSQVTDLSSRLSASIESLTQAVSEKAQQSDVEEKMNQLTEEFASHMAEKSQELTEQFSSRLSEKSDKSHVTDLSGSLSKSISDVKRNLLDQHRRLALLLEETRKRMPEPISEDQIKNMVSEEDHLLDAMYASFEDRFRGTREDIKGRQQVCLETIDQAGIGTDDAPIIDLGCGRGEWLELLKENSKTAIGVDINRVFVSGCRDIGLDIVERDALSYLRDLKPETAGAITSFHLIEHLPLKTLIALLDEALRVLKPGGIVIFETPNPENMKVGSCNFYIDPTHCNPLPPVTTQYLLEARGFVQCHILRLHPFDEGARARDMVESGPSTLIEEFYGPQDYAVIGYKAK